MLHQRKTKEALARLQEQEKARQEDREQISETSKSSTPSANHNFRNQHLRPNRGGFRWPRLPGGGHNWSWQKILALLGIGTAALGILSIILFFSAIAVLSIGLPDVKDLDKLAVAESTTIYDREGNILYVKYGEENREYVPLEKISQNLIDATLAIEDDQFYNHPGFDTFGLTRAVFNNFIGRNTQGGSTITQQYIKLTFLSSEKTFTRKIKELILAVRLEQAFSKDLILEKYLNKIPYGNNAYGIQKAAEIYFNKNASELTVAESAILAAIPQAPGYYNPFGPNKFARLSSNLDPEALERRQIDSETDLRSNEIIKGLLSQEIKINDNQSIRLSGRTDLVLRRMVEIGRITEEERALAEEEIGKIEFAKHKQSIKAPHFVFNVLQQLEDKYGKETVTKGGLKVYTTIDPTLQESAEKIISDRAADNQKKYNVKNSALVAMNPKTGEILAMVGSRNYFDEEIDGKTNVTTSFRQPGSSFKPIVYAKMFEEKHGPGTIIFDVPTAFGADSPKNFDGKFLGPISIRTALGKSRNIPAIKSYFLAGEDQAILEYAKAMGVNFRDENLNYGYPMSLGSAETTLLSMTNAYATFANEGKHLPPVSILRIEDSTGQTLEEWHSEAVVPEQVIKPEVAFMISNILSDRNINVGPNLNVNNQINAAKTGTSNIKKGNQYLPNDLLTLGYTTNLAVGVWSGNNDSRKDGYLNASADGYNISAPIFKAFMESALKNSPSEDFPMPTTVKKYSLSKYTGKLAAPNTAPDQLIEDYFPDYSAPTETSQISNENPDFTESEKLTQLICPTGNAQKRVNNQIDDIDPTRELWQTAAQKWLQENSEINQQFIGSTLTCVPTPDSQKLTVQITSPNDGQQINNEVKVNIQAESAAGHAIKEAHFYLDNDFKYQQDQAPFSATLKLPRNSKETEFSITVRVFDIQGNVGSSQVKVTTQKPPTTTSPAEDENTSAVTEPASDTSLPPVTN